MVSILPLMGLYKLSSETGPGLAASFLAVISILTAFLYYRDKRAAERGRRRTPESVLHLLEFLGGWPCAFWAQRILRHKIRKVAYQIVFWIIGLLHQFLAWEYLTGWTFLGSMFSA